MSHFMKFVTDGNEKADVLEKAGVMLDEGFMAETREDSQQEREREDMFAALQCAASLHCLVEKWKDCEELKPKPKERLIFVDKKRGNRAPHGVVCKYQQLSMYEMWKSKYMEMQGTCTGPKNLSADLGKWRKRHLGGYDMVRRMDRQAEVLIWP